MGRKKKDADNLPHNMSLDAEQQKEFSQKVDDIKKKDGLERGVIYVGHIPRGFFEEQMKEYFSQFGRVTRLRLSRSKKTGRDKGYAFVEFEREAVARIVADTMNNYLMFHKLLKCKFVTEDKLHPETFKGAHRSFKKPKAHLIAADRHNSVKSEQQVKLAERKILKRKAKSLQKLADMGIEYSFPGVKVPTALDVTAGEEGKSKPPPASSSQDVGGDEEEDQEIPVPKRMRTTAVKDSSAGKTTPPPKSVQRKKVAKKLPAKGTDVKVSPNKGRGAKRKTSK